MALKWNRTHQLLAYTDDMNLLGDRIDTLKKNTETVIDVIQEASLGVNRGNQSHMGVSCYQNVCQNRHIEVANRKKNGVFWDVTPCGRLLQEPHGVTSQKAPFFIFTAVKTSNLNSKQKV
jgi:hypothetical protein